jgi:hypothetical protein
MPRSKDFILSAERSRGTRVQVPGTRWSDRRHRSVYQDLLGLASRPNNIWRGAGWFSLTLMLVSRSTPIAVSYEVRVGSRVLSVVEPWRQFGSHSSASPRVRFFSASRRISLRQTHGAFAHRACSWATSPSRQVPHIARPDALPRAQGLIRPHSLHVLVGGTRWGCRRKATPNSRQAKVFRCRSPGEDGPNALNGVPRSEVFVILVVAAEAATDFLPTSAKLVRTVR